MRMAGLLTLVFAPMLALGCDEKRTPEEYTVRGRITAMPAGEQSEELDIHHEAIPTYKHRDGQVRGMDAMVMTFAPASGTSLQGLAVGDPVQMTFEVRWDEHPALVIRQIQELQPDTQLGFEP